MIELVSIRSKARSFNAVEMIQTLQTTMEEDVGTLRDEAQLTRALGTIGELTQALGDGPPGEGKAFDMQRLDWFDLRNMLLVARTVAAAASRRQESRGAHQRADYPGMLPTWDVNQIARCRDDHITLSNRSVTFEMAAQ